MSLKLTEVKALTSRSEFELIQSSRGAKLRQLAPAALKEHARRARKLLQKWRDQSRRQQRSSTRKHGFPDLYTRTQQKVAVFEDALAAFEGRLAQLDSSAAPKPSKAKRTAPAADQRPAASPTTKAPAAKATAKKEGASSGGAAARAAAKPRPAAKPPKAPPVRTSKLAAGLAQSQFSLPPSKLRKASAAAKLARLTTSGRTTRLRSHVTASGKRKQARRDKKHG
jgi:hypothetical protein